MSADVRRDRRARRSHSFSASVMTLESRNLLSAAGTVTLPSLTAMEKALVRVLDAYVQSHPGSITQIANERQALLTQINNPRTPSAIRQLEQVAIDIDTQVLLDNGYDLSGGVKPPS